eukprot:jgi/Undpi1/9117/HiC_scaffold_26.g11575.m1
MTIPGSSKAFHLACMDGDTAAVQRWLDAGLYVDKRDAVERTGLHQAAWSGRVQVASLLLGAHADANARDRERRTPLHFCCQAGHSAVIKPSCSFVYSSFSFTATPQELLAFAADVNAADNKLETPLSKAARSGRVEVVGVLLAAGANVEIRDADGHLAGDTFSSKVSPETREKIIAMRRSRQQEELAAAKKDEEEPRIAQNVQTEGGEGQTHTHGVEVKPGRRLGVEDQRAGESVPR